MYTRLIFIFFLEVFLLSSSWSAVGQSANSIEVAQAFALKKDRKSACATLINAINASPTSLRARARLIESLDQIAKTFFTDKGQRKFESARAMMWDDPDTSVSQLKLALEDEDDNLDILNHLARVYLFKQDCGQATATTKRAREMNPFNGEAFVLEIAGLACSRKFEELREAAKVAPKLDKSQASALAYLLALDSLKQNLWKKTQESAKRLMEELPGFPESHLLWARAAEGLGDDPTSGFERYVSLCKALDVKVRRKFWFEPRMCTSLIEVTDELAKRNTEM